MDEKTLYQYIKLGMNLEYLNGIGTVSILLGTSMVAFPNLTMNLPGHRYPVKTVVETLRSLFAQLKDLGLEKSLATAEPALAMLQEMEQHMSKVPPERHLDIKLQDRFADRLTGIARQVSLVVRQETSNRTAGGSSAE
ncbi:MAG: hypothetical protein O3B13_11255 [Planctomycetota bacterium]|nr:hypothetical protein [Planctomycetota bacterium]MDA1163668.1 hypothetical protein [Planctomycetota bacterium]